MEKYQFVDFGVIGKQLTEALEKGLGRSLDIREIKYIQWLAECDYETSGLLIDWIKELTK